VGRAGVSVTDYKGKLVPVIRYRGTPNKGQLPDGTWVYKQDRFYIREWNRHVRAAPYDNHFLYEMPSRYKGPAFRCSCGSFAVIAGYSSYATAASEQGLLVVCYWHATFGTHVTGESRWI